MKKIKQIALKELGFYLNSPIGYIVIGGFVILLNFLFWNDFFLVGVSSVRVLLDLMPWLMLFLIGAFTMRMFAEEKKLNTIELWLTLPVAEEEVVAGKFLGGLLMILITLLLTLTVPLTVAFLGPLSLTEVLSGYLGLVLFGAFLVALGGLISSLTKNQILSLLMSIAAFVGLGMLGTETFIRYLPESIGEVMVYLSPLYHLETFLRGLVSFRSLVYFLSFTFLFLQITFVLLKERE